MNFNIEGRNIRPLSSHEAQLRLAEALQIVQTYGRIPTKSFPPFIGGRRREKELLEILNWIAQCFVLSNDGSSYATALSIKFGVIELHIAKNNPLPPTPSEMEFASLFLKETKRIYRNQITDLRTIPGSSRAKAYGEEALSYMKLVVDKGWPRVLRKVSLIRTSHHGNVDVVACFNNVVDRWVTYRSSSTVPPKGADQLKPSFLSIVSTPIPTDSDARFLFIKEMSFHCTTLLVFCSFFEDLHSENDAWRTHLSQEELLLLLRLSRRIKRVAAYWRSAFTFVQAGLAFFRKLLSPNGPSADLDDHLRIVWANELHHSPPADVLRMTRSPRDAIIDLELEGRVSAKLLPQILELPGIDELWDSGDTFSLRIHAEVRLLHHLLRTSSLPTKMVMGASKRVCDVCHHYLHRVRKAKKWDDPWILLEAAPHKVVKDWLIPHLPSGGLSDESHKYIVFEVIYAFLYTARFALKAIATI